MKTSIKNIFIPNEENQYRPKWLETKVLFYYLIIILCLKVILLGTIFWLPQSNFFADVSKAVLVNLINNERTKYNAPPLTINPKLEEAAYLKGKDMIQNGYFAHYSPKGVSPWYWFDKVGYNYKYAGENLAIGFVDTVEVHNALFSSPSHRANILQPLYKEIGIAVIKDNFQGKETSIVVQLFGNEKNLPPAEKTVTPVNISSPTSVPAGNVLSETTSRENLENTSSATKSNIVANINPEEKNDNPNPTTSIIMGGENNLTETQNSLKNNFFGFMLLKYNSVVQTITYASLVFAILSLLIAIIFDIFVYRKFKIDYKDFILKELVFCSVLISFIILDKQTIIALIPHQLVIF